MKYTELTESNFDETVKEGIVLIDFFANWCSPCRMMSSVIEELADDFEGKVKICKVNTDDNYNLVEKYEIKSIPMILFFKDGELIDRIVGVSSKQILTDKIGSLL